MHKEYIIYDPFWGLNAYIENMKKCWGELYKVVSFSYVDVDFFIQIRIFP